MGADKAACCKWLGRVRLLVAAGLLFASLANAHLMSAGLGAVHVREHDAVVLIGVPVAMFEGADDDGDGLLQPNEIKAHRTEILEQLARSFHLLVGGKPAVVKEAHLMVSVHAQDGVSTPQLEWWALLELDRHGQANACMQVDLQWFGGPKQWLQELSYTLQVQRAGEVQTAVFSKGQALYAFGCGLDGREELH
jgi:hypothetical protein